MGIAIDTSTNGKYSMFSSENATLATVLAEVLDELETQNKSSTKTDFMLTYDVGNSKYAFVAVCKN